MTYTDQQLKQTLAKMLPEKIRYSGNDFAWIGSEGGFIGYVRDTELLHLCQMVEQTLSETAHSTFRVLLRKGSPFIPIPNESLRLRLRNATTASWQQRTIALAKVKGIEIV